MTDPNLPPQQGYTPPPAYAAPPPGYQPDLVPRTNTLAIIALILGIIVAPAGIICGHIALSQIKRTHEQGHGLALAGTIIGYVLTALSLIVIVGEIIFFVVLASTVGSVAGQFPSAFPSDLPS